MMKPLSRRALLRGAGTAISLPFLEAMLPAFVTTPDVPVRLMYVYAPTGMMMNEWTPATAGTDFELRRILRPLAPYRSDLTILTGLGDNPGRALGDGNGDHARAASSYLTGAHPKKTQGADIRAGISVDQIAARSLAGRTRFASLELTCEDSRQAGECDSYSCAYQAISWKSETQPLPPEMNPRLLFERLFGEMDISASPAERENRRAYRQSILDLTLAQTQTLQGKLGAADRRKLDEYLTSIREVEQRLSTAGQVPLPEGLAKPSGIPADYAEHARLLFDLVAIAFQTDLTRVVTFMMAREGGLRTYAECGVPEAHHSISHHGGRADLIEKLLKIEVYHLEQFAYLVGRLKGMKEGTGSVLDHAALVYGASMGDPNRHDHGKCPTVIAGKAGGNLRGGRHVIFPDETPMANLHLSLLDAMGVPTNHLGDSTGKLNFLTNV